MSAPEDSACQPDACHVTREIKNEVFDEGIEATPVINVVVNPRPSRYSKGRTTTAGSNIRKEVSRLSSTDSSTDTELDRREQSKILHHENGSQCISRSAVDPGDIAPPVGSIRVKSKALLCDDEVTMCPTATARSRLGERTAAFNFGVSPKQNKNVLALYGLSVNSSSEDSTEHRVGKVVPSDGRAVHTSKKGLTSSAVHGRKPVSRRSSRNKSDSAMSSDENNQNVMNGHESDDDIFVLHSNVPAPSRPTPESSVNKSVPRKTTPKSHSKSLITNYFSPSSATSAGGGAAHPNRRSGGRCSLGSDVTQGRFRTPDDLTSRTDAAPNHGGTPTGACGVGTPTDVCGGGITTGVCGGGLVRSSSGLYSTARRSLIPSSSSPRGSCMARPVTVPAPVVATRTNGRPGIGTRINGGPGMGLFNGPVDSDSDDDVVPLTIPTITIEI